MRFKLCFKLICFLFLLQNCKDIASSNLETSPHISHTEVDAVVMDSSNLFSKAERDSLTFKIITYENATTNEIGILTIDSISTGKNLQNYGTQIANKLGIGKRKKDNGLLITISRFDRKIAISTGLGTEKTISDYECKIIIDSIIKPHFTAGNYYKGVTKGLDSLVTLWD